MHGKCSMVQHNGRGVFTGLPDPLEVTRYHSLVIDPSSLPDELEVTAWSETGEVMGVRHRSLPIEGVQFHPESLFTAYGLQIVGNALLSACRQEANKEMVVL
jgi:anthranilate synthase/aminodeoxychorismate synthase-like glutamine amidotransferase